MTRISLPCLSIKIIAALLLGFVLGGPAVAAAQDASLKEWTRLGLAQRHKEAQQLAEVQYQAAKAAGDPTLLANWSLALARSDKQMGRFDRAEALFLEGIAYCRDNQGPEHAVTVNATVDLGNFYLGIGRVDDAERLIRKGLAILQRTEGEVSIDTGHAHDLLAKCLDKRGQLGEAERQYKLAMAAFLATQGPGNHNTLSMFLNIGMMYIAQARFDEGEAAFKKLLGECRKHLQPDDPIVATTLESLAECALHFERFGEAESLYRKALAIVEKNYGAEHTEVARIDMRLGDVMKARDRLPEADALYKKSLAIYQKIYGRNSPEIVDTLIRMAMSHADRKDNGQAVAVLDRCVALLKQTAYAAETRYDVYRLRSRYGERVGLVNRGIDDLRKALDIAEEQRGSVSGGSRERSLYFAKFSIAYEELVRMLAKRGDKKDLGEMFATMERFHARGLIDEMQMFGADPDLGRPPGEREKYQREEAELRRQITDLETRLNAEKDDARAEAIGAELLRANNRLYQHYREVQETSPVYQRLINQKAKLGNLRDVQRRLLRPGDMLVEYLLGEYGGYFMAVTPDSAEIFSFAFTAQESKIMEVDAGSLTANRARRAFLNEKGTGLIQQLANPKAPVPVDKLHVMWNTVLYEPKIQKMLTDGTIKRLIVIADGPLGMLPFEALVTSVGPDGPVYFLDSGPPVVYAPSAAVLLNQFDRPDAARKGGEPVLTLGDPAYAGTGPGAGAAH